MATKKTTGTPTKTGSTRKPRTSKQPAEVTPIDRASDNGASNIESFPSATVHPGLEEEIRQRAYELYEERGRQHGLDQEDWDRAQTEILQRYQKEKSA